MLKCRFSCLWWKKKLEMLVQSSQSKLPYILRSFHTLRHHRESRLFSIASCWCSGLRFSSFALSMTQVLGQSRQSHFLLLPTRWTKFPDDEKELLDLPDSFCTILTNPGNIFDWNFYQIILSACSDAFSNDFLLSTFRKQSDHDFLLLLRIIPTACCKIKVNESLNLIRTFRNLPIDGGSASWHWITILHDPWTSKSELKTFMFSDESIAESIRTELSTLR